MKSEIQVFLENGLFTVLTVFKVMIQSQFFIRIKTEIKTHNTCLILGNGPSLKQTLEQYPELQEKKNFNVMCVNYFCNSEYYGKIKPDYYVLNAPEFWLPEVEKDFSDSRQILLENIRERTHWPLNIFIPAISKKHPWFVNKLKENSNIRVGFYNATPVEGYSFFRQLCYSYQLGMPRPHNVLIPCLMLSMFLKYQNIFLLGADHSWLKELHVTEENVALLSQPHFYDKGKVEALPMHKLGKGRRKLHEILQKFVYSFQAYFEIYDYAKANKVKIYNSTKNSYIDAFERKDIREIIYAD